MGGLRCFSPLSSFTIESRKYIRKGQFLHLEQSINPHRASFPDLREAGETSYEKEKWDGMERRGRGVSLEQTVADISTLGGDKCVIISQVLQTTLPNNEVSQETMEAVLGYQGAALVRGLFTRAFIWGQ